MIEQAPTPSRLARGIRLGWLLGIGASFLALVGSLVVIIVGSRHTHDAAPLVLAAAGVTAFACGNGLLAAAVMCRRQLPVFMSVSMLLALAGAGGWLVLVRDAFHGAPAPTPHRLRLLVTCTVVAVGLAVLGYLLTSPHRQIPLVRSRRLLVGSITTLGAAVLLFLWSRFWERYSIVLAALLALGIVGTTVSLLGHLLVGWYVRSRSARSAESLAGRKLTIVCPKCGLRQTLACGLVHCRRCRLTLQIAIEEPRCDCGYLLYQLDGDTCPECGRKHSGGSTLRGSGAQ